MFQIYSSSPQIASFGEVSTIEIARESVELYQEIGNCSVGSIVVNVNTNPLVVATFCGECWSYCHDNLELYYKFVVKEKATKKIPFNTHFQRSLNFYNRVRTSLRVRYNRYVAKIQK
jgi:hypothetical protein